jgi:hypothetical protein
MDATYPVRRTAVLALLFAVLAASLAAGAGTSPVSVPQDTTLMTIKYGNDDTEAKLKPEEQVAFLFVYGIWNLEDRCLSDSEVARLCTIEELVKGVSNQGGEMIGLTVDPNLDTNYSYDIAIVGDSCMVRALPRVAGLGAFGMAGSLRRGGGTFYYNPTGADLIRGTVRLTEYGYEGSGFGR